jgi:hypothetical protein
VQTLQPNAVARLHGPSTNKFHFGSADGPRGGKDAATAPFNPDRAKSCEDALGPRLTVAKAPQDALDDPGCANDLETNRSQGNETGNHNHRLLKVRVWTSKAEGAGQDEDER